MLKVWLLTLICSSPALLCGCQKAGTDVAGSNGLGTHGNPADVSGKSVPSVTQAVPGTQSGIAGSTSVPAAETAVAPSALKPADTASSGRTNSEMSRAQESSAMPMPGQVNDHSAPLVTDKPPAPARRASSP